MAKTQRSVSDKRHIVAVTSRLKSSELKALRFAMEESDEDGFFRSNGDSAERFFAHTGLKKTVFFTSVARLARMGCLDRRGRGIYKINDLWRD